MRRGTPKLRIVECDAAVQEVHTRMPFRYGGAALTRAPLLHVRARVVAKDGSEATGMAADCLPPGWFDRDPAKSFERQVNDQIAAFRAARHAYLEAASAPLAAWEIWQSAHSRAMDECARRGLNRLTAAFGASFLERCLIDAVCRLKQASFFEVLRSEWLGFDTARHLRETPLDQIRCRHTVGLADPITRGEIVEDERADDGLPQALEEDIDAYGPTRFKLKIGGDVDRDLERLARVAVLIHQRCPTGYAITLDANEQYPEAARMERLLEALRAKPYGRELVDAILYIEQPLARDRALDPSAAAEIAALAALKPLVIDESDDALDAFDRAEALGYLGVTHKNAKGVFKSLLRHTAMAVRNRERKKQKLAPLFQCGEDLVCLPVVSLQQDLAALAALGIADAERSGHHYFRGLAHVPEAEAKAAAAAHSDLYEERAGEIFLRIQNGAIAVKSLQAPGFGYHTPIAFEARTPLEQWTFDRLEAGATHV